MRLYFDTSAVVPALIREHPQHSAAFPALDRVRREVDEGVVSAHGLAELYGALTRLPIVPRITGAQAWELIESNILRHFGIHGLTPRDYRELLGTCSERGWVGAVIYDFLHIQTARKHGCDRLLTFNLKDFRLLAEDVEWIVTPS